MQQVRDQVFDKKSRKHVANRTNSSKTWLQTWSKARFAAGYNNGMWPLSESSLCCKGAVTTNHQVNGTFIL